MIRYRKAITAVLLAAAILLPAAMPAAAADGAPQITIASVTAAIGESVTVEVMLTGCESFSCYELVIAYDPALLTPTKSKRVIGAGGLFMPNLEYGEGKIYCSYINASSCRESGVMFTLTFDTSSEISGIKTAALTFERCDLLYFDGSKDIKYDVTAVYGQVVVTGGGDHIIVDDGSEGSENSEVPLYPIYIPDDSASDYTNPLTGDKASSGGYYYYNEDNKIAVPASDAEDKVITDPDGWKIASGSSSEPAQSGSDGGQQPVGAGGKGGWLYFLYVGCALIIFAGAFVAYRLIRRRETEHTESSTVQDNSKEEQDNNEEN